MKQMSVAFLGALTATMLLTGCAPHRSTQQLGSAPAPIYENAEQIAAMPPCKAKVVERAPCGLYLTTTEGNGLYLGSPGSNAHVHRFLETLKDGQTYVLPDAFLQYQKHHPASEP
jgi:hypothetical protein